MEWNPLQHPYIQDGYDISPYGDIRYNKSELTYKASYHSTNGYDYAMFTNTDGKQQLFPIDEIVAMVYLPVPDELCGKRLMVKHINGDTHDISLDNLEWVEDVEIWKDITYPGVKTGLYEVSNHGRVRNKYCSDIPLIRFINNGYRCCYLNNHDGRKKIFLEHRLVWFQFIKHEEDDINSLVNHINSNRSSNVLRNIETADHSRNNSHALLCGQQPNALDVYDVMKICEYIRDEDGCIDNVMCRLKDGNISVKRDAVCNIIQKYTWKTLSDLYFDDRYVRHQKRSMKTPNKRLCDADVHMICNILIEEDGNVERTYNRLCHNRNDISKDVVASIRSKTSWKHISDQYFSKDTYSRTIDESDVEMICKLIVEYNGKISAIKKVIDDKGKSYISYAVIKNIKNKETWSSISDNYFNKNQYGLLLSEDVVIDICEEISKHKDAKKTIDKVFDSLKNRIPYLTKSMIRHILYKNAWSNISDQFF